MALHVVFLHKQTANEMSDIPLSNLCIMSMTTVMLNVGSVFSKANPREHSKNTQRVEGALLWAVQPM